MVIDKMILDNLTNLAKNNPRLRQAKDLRNSLEDGSQRMLNALEPGTIMPIHRHHASSETVVVLRGVIKWIFYDESGHETESVVLDADGEVRCLIVYPTDTNSSKASDMGKPLWERADDIKEFRNFRKIGIEVPMMG